MTIGARPPRSPLWPALVLSLVVGCAPRDRDGMILVPGGAFTLGVDHSMHSDEMPAHRVVISAFYMDATLVTLADFRAFVAATGYRTSAERIGTGKTSILGMDDWDWREVRGLSWRAPWGEANARFIPLGDDTPVTMVSWYDAAAYCAWAGKRLPSEAEWEYAMRAGATSRFPWGDMPRPGGDSARPRLNYWEGLDHGSNPAAHTGDGDGHRAGDGYVYLSPVRAYAPNRWGFYDPVGNVWQWVDDWWSDLTFAIQADDHPEGARDPRGPAEGTFKVARGGSWWCSAMTCHGYGLVARGKTRPEAPFSNNGFRCAADIVKAP